MYLMDSVPSLERCACANSPFGGVRPARIQPQQRPIHFFYRQAAKANLTGVAFVAAIRDE
jgi:hypothetical protein